MNRFGLLIMLMLLACGGAFAGETINAKEVESYLYADSMIKRSKGQFEITYYIEGDTVTRTRVYDLNKQKVIPDDTIYRIQRNLWSDPTKRMSFSSKPVIRAVGQPGADAIEVLAIGETFIQSVKSTSDYFVISRLKRMK